MLSRAFPLLHGSKEALHQVSLEGSLQSGPVQCSDHWNLSGVLQLMLNLSPKSPQGTKVPLSNSLEFRRLYLLFASDTCILSSDDRFGEINGCQWAVGKRALTFPNPNPQNATGVQPSAFGGFGTHVPGTTIQSVVSRLHLQKETCTNGYGKTTTVQKRPLIK